jgi:hypothetical protein
MAEQENVPKAEHIADEKKTIAATVDALGIKGDHGGRSLKQPPPKPRAAPVPTPEPPVLTKAEQDRKFRHGSPR